jgi:predicted O-methyltransferase YrrM
MGSKPKDIKNYTNKINFNIDNISDTLTPVEYKEEHKFFLDFQKKIYDEYSYVLDKLNPTDYFWFVDKETHRKQYYKTNAHAYYPLYADYLNHRRKSVKKVLEIGVYTGYSMLMWREYFPNAEIVGVDISLEHSWMGKNAKDVCKGKDRITLIEADGTKKEVAKRVGEEFGEFDVIVDDGSHHPTDQILSLIYFLPYLKLDGLYVIEDIIVKTQRHYLNNYFNAEFVEQEKDVKLFEEFYEDLKTDILRAENMDLKPYGIKYQINQDSLFTIDTFEIKKPPPHQIGRLYSQILQSKLKMAFITKKDYTK